MIDHAHIVFRESSPEPGEGGMIGIGIVKRKPQKLFERDSVVDLSFQLGIGIDFKPLLKKKAFHENKRRISVVAFKAFTDGIVSHKQAFNSRPVDNSIDLFHSFDSPIFFHGVKKGNIGKGEVGFHFFEAHSSSTLFNLKELCQENRGLSSNIYNNINILALNGNGFQQRIRGKELVMQTDKQTSCAKVSKDKSVKEKLLSIFL